MEGHGHGGHGAARHGEGWSHLVAEQQQRLGVVDAWWDLLGRPVGKRLADVGCGPGLFAARFADLGADVLAVEVRREALVAVPSRPRLRTLLHDLDVAPLPERVDVAVFSDVLHHVRRPERMLRHARESASLVLVAEAAPRRAQPGGAKAVPRLAPEEALRLLRAAGFAPETPVWPTEDQYAVVARSTERPATQGES